MNIKILVSTIILAASGLAVPVDAQEPSNKVPAKSNSVLNACIQNQAETLPNPFSDVPSNHWAFKAVMTMYYCGAFRQATPPALFEQVQPTEKQQQPFQSSQPQN
ncbi:MAG: S-layer protein [Chlorogloeopsis fritschii C42_A2020_084]|uniref:S-layer protein n=1 Tax=Chlorogloeopsis fritschii TaxID=1124 RepID=UPI0019E0791C|nr:S-layer protein [Chlorogloeopsis fritschii]MBF2008114.1 S-layer protein [Chlorogloeopsis fritschii C42_A2020_084]